MKLSDTVHIPAPPETVWQGLNDPDVLKAAIPGCKSIEKVSDTEFKATAAVTFGPVKATFGGKVTLSELNPPHGYRISGEGTGGAAGFASGSANVRLTRRDEGTDLSYEVEASVGGKIAQIGQRFIDQAAKKMADDFFGRFASAVAPKVASPAEAAPAIETAPEPVAAQQASAAPKASSDKSPIPLVPGPEELAEGRRNLPRKLIVVAVVIALLILLVIYTH